MTLWEKYLELNPDLLRRLDLIDKESGEKFTKKLKAERDKENFLAIITELQFYEFFAQQGFGVILEKQYSLKEKRNRLKPDFTIAKNGQPIIAEVLKLNPTNKDNKRNEFENDLIEEIEKIKKGCSIQISFVHEYFDTSLYNKQHIITLFGDWLSTNFYLDAEVILFDNFRFTVINIDDAYEHVCVIGNVNSIDIDVRRLNSRNSGFVKKISKYYKLANDLNIPYIICLKIDFHAAISENQMFWTMYGDLLSYNHSNKSESKMNGLYYRNEDAKEGLSGVLLLVNNNFYFYNNYSSRNKLNKENKNEFLKNQFFGEIPNKLVVTKK